MLGVLCSAEEWSAAGVSLGIPGQRCCVLLSLLARCLCAVSPCLLSLDLLTCRRQVRIPAAQGLRETEMRLGGEQEGGGLGMLVSTPL